MHISRTIGSRLIRERRKQADDQSRIENQLNEEILTDTDKLIFPFRNNRFNGLDELYNLPITAGYPLIDIMNQELQIMRNTYYYQYLQSRFEKLATHLEGGTSLVIVDQRITKNYQSDYDHKALFITPNNNNFTNNISFFQDWRQSGLSIIQDSTSNIEGLFFETDSGEKISELGPLILKPGAYEVSKEQVLVSTSTEPNQNEQRALHFFSMKKILKESRTYPFSITCETQEEQHKKLLLSLCQAYIGESFLNNQSLIVGEGIPRYLSSRTIYDQAKMIYRINTFFETFDQIFRQKEDVSKLSAAYTAG
ncbi:MAG: hypothetical protein KC535_01320 [Nanoarchaeota archaeon]|nr:hypothetical protein [Nanoarchaeota archaeon]